ncbi:MAG: hypothetical protein ACM3O7_01990 [Acidobacteriota bacterium]
MLGLVLAATLAAAPSPRLGADVVIDRPTGGTVAAVAGTVRVSSLVHGDVVALAGDVELLPGARVEGDVVALGGSVSGQAPVSGRTVQIAPLGARELPLVTSGRQAVGLDLLRVGGWIVLVTLLVSVAPHVVRRAGDELRRQAWRAGVIGISSLAAWLAVIVLGLVASATPVGLIVIGLAVALFMAAKLLGLAVCAFLMGTWLSPWLPIRLRGAIPRAGVAMGLLAAAAMVPYVGTSLWVLANVFGIGAVVSVVASPQPVVLALSRIAAR